ncbi:MAG: hypothetical protein EAZ16_02385 [Sphingobacteriales bacterium]|nr:MAG: hypothetical protein EAZ16_02385 [Sphingobacteriales bacterium]
MSQNNISEIKKGVFFILFALLAIWAYQVFIRDKIEDAGKCLKCVILKSEGRKGGITTTVQYKYKGVVYLNTLSTKSKLDIGKEYFIKILPGNPEAIIFFEEILIPDCLVGIESPSEGWKVIPSCN